MSFTLHLPEDMDIAHPVPSVRAAWIAAAGETVAAARAIGAPVLNLHMQPGVHFSLPHSRIYAYARHEAEYLSHIDAFGSGMYAIIGDRGPLITLENTGIYDLPFVCRGVEALLAYPCFALTWDVGHDRESGWKDRAFMESHIGRIRHMHLHDGIAGRAHLPLGTGDVDWRKALRLAQQNGCRVVIEVKTLAGLRASLDLIREYDRWGSVHDAGPLPGDV